MTALRFLLPAAGLAVLLSSCAENALDTTHATYAPAEKLASYQTYAWSSRRSLTLRDPSLDTSATKGWIERDVATALESKGLTTADPSSADLLVGYSAGSRTLSSSQEFTSLGEESVNSLDAEGGNVSFVERGTLNTDYEVGRLFLDLTDRKSGQVVYRGSTTTPLLTNPSPSRSQSRIRHAVTGMLAGFPKR